MKALLNFYGKKASPCVDSEEILEKMQLSKPPTLQEIKMELEFGDGCGDIFPEMFKLLNILLVLPVGIASVERFFRQMKLVKTRLRSRLNEACKD